MFAVFVEFAKLEREYRPAMHPLSETKQEKNRESGEKNEQRGKRLAQDGSLHVLYATAKYIEGGKKVNGTVMKPAVPEHICQNRSEFFGLRRGNEQLKRKQTVRVGEVLEEARREYEAS